MPRPPGGIGCRAHTGWAALVVVGGSPARPEILLRCRADLADPHGRVRKNAYQASRGLKPSDAATRVAAAERVAGEHAAAALEAIAQEHEVRVCAVVTGAFAGAPLESILASHALAHAAEGKLYQEALLRGATSLGLDAVSVTRRSIWEQGESALGIGREELKSRLDGLRAELDAPWAEDQKLAALAAWIALAR
jgi:hypothetical protein